MVRYCLSDNSLTKITEQAGVVEVDHRRRRHVFIGIREPSRFAILRQMCYK
jgi:hypothetical protein